MKAKKFDIDKMIIAFFNSQDDLKTRCDIFIQKNCFKYLEIKRFDPYDFEEEGLVKCAYLFETLDGKYRAALNFEGIPYINKDLEIRIESFIPLKEVYSKPNKYLTSREAYQLLQEYLKEKKEESCLLKR